MNDRKLPELMYIVVSVISQAAESPKRYVQSDFRDFGGPSDAQTLRI